METQDQIRQFLLKRIGENHPLQNDEDIFKAGYVNSLFALELVTFLEKNFDIEVANEDLDLQNFNSVNHLEAFVNRKKETVG